MRDYTGSCALRYVTYCSEVTRSRGDDWTRDDVERSTQSQIQTLVRLRRPRVFTILAHHSISLSSLCQCDGLKESILHTKLVLGSGVRKSPVEPGSIPPGGGRSGGSII